ALSGPSGVNRLGRLGLGVQAGGALGLEGAEGIADGLRDAAEGGGDLGRPPPLGALQEDLTAAQSEGIRRAQSGLQGVPLGSSEGADEKGWFHSCRIASRSALAQDELCVCTRLVRRPPLDCPLGAVDATGVGEAVLDLFRQADIEATLYPIGI